MDEKMAEQVISEPENNFPQEAQKLDQTEVVWVKQMLKQVQDFAVDHVADFDWSHEHNLRPFC